MKGKINDTFNRVKKPLKKYFSTNILFSTYVVSSLLIGLLVRLLTLGNILEIKPIIFDLIFALLVGSFGYFLRPKNQFRYFMTWLLIFTFLGVANTIYYDFFKSFVSVNLISTAIMVGEVKDSVWDKIKLFQFVYLAFPVILFFVHRKLHKRKYYFEVEKIEKGKQMFLKTLASGFLLLILVIATLSSMEVSRFVKQWNREYIVQRFGLYTYTVNDVFQSIQPKINTLFGYDDAVRNFVDFYEFKPAAEKNKYTNIYKGKNVIFIHAESIQNFLIDLKINGKEVTPNLNKLSKEGLYFSNFYPQISVGTSSDTEFTISTGLLPSSSGTVFVNYFDRTYESIQKKFSDLGYYTFSMHANNADYWNRKLMHSRLGYKQFYAKDSYEIPEEKSDSDWIVLGLSDKSFFKQIIPIFKDIKLKEEPFMSTIITLTNHSPFKDIYSDIDKYDEFKLTQTIKEVGEDGTIQEKEANYLLDTDMGNYIKSAHYADAALGQLFADLKSEGLLENTVIVLYGDHEAKLGRKALNLLYNYDPYTDSIKTSDDPTYITLEDYNYDLVRNTPLIIWDKTTKNKKKIKDAMGMYDVAPTIANMFGFEMKYSIGNDIFSKNEKIVIFPNGNFLTNKVYYSSLNEEYIPINKDPIDENYIERLKEYTEKRLDVSNSIIIHDLIKNSETKLEVKDEKSK